MTAVELMAKVSPESAQRATVPTGLTNVAAPAPPPTPS